MNAWSEYSYWLKRYKHLVKEKPELKKLVITKLKEAVDKTRSDNDYLALDAEIEMEQPISEIDTEQTINIFDEYMKELH